MAELRDERGQRSCILIAEHLIGRGPQCALRMPPAANYVSSQHAVIRWSGNGWELLDRGSRNGTWINGEAVERGRPYRLIKGAVITFGHPDERWVLSDTSEPQTMVLALDTGETRFEQFGMIGLPSNESPEVTLFKDADGVWKLEDVEGNVHELSNGQTIEASGRSYLFSFPSTGDLTASIGTGLPGDAPTLLFVVSSDEDYVELSLEYEKRKLALGSRAHNYLLLTLARQRLADLASGVAPPSCGWMEKERLAAGLRMTRILLDGEIWRLRKHFAHHGYPNPTGIIESRTRTGLIRIGLDRIRIERR